MTTVLCHRKCVYCHASDIALFEHTHYHEVACPYCGRLGKMYDLPFNESVHTLIAYMNAYNGALPKSYPTDPAVRARLILEYSG